MRSSFAAPGWHTSPGWLGRVEVGEAAGPGTTRIKDVAAAGMTERVPGGDKTRQVRPARGAAGGHALVRPGGAGRGSAGRRARPRGFRRRLPPAPAVEPRRSRAGPDHRLLRGGRVLSRGPGRLRRALRAARRPGTAAAYRVAEPEAGRGERHGYPGGARDRAAGAAGVREPDLVRR